MSNNPPQGAYGYHDDISHQMIEAANEGQEQPDNSFSSSANMAISIKPRARRPSIFHIGGDSPPHLSNPHSQRAGLSLTIPPPTGTTNIFPPISLDSFQQEIPPLNPGQDSSLFCRDHSLVPSPISRTRVEQDLGLIIGNQMGGRHSQANRSQAMGMANQGHSFAPNHKITPSFGNDIGATQPYHLPVSNLPSDFRLDSSSRLQLPQPTLQGGDGGFSFKTAWSNSSPQNQMTMNQPLINPTGSQEIQFEGLLNQVPGQSTFYQVAGAGGSSQNQALNMPISPVHGIGLPSLPLPLHVEGLSENNQNKRRMNESFLNPGQFGAGDIPARSPKRQTTWQDNNYFPTTKQFSQAAMPSPNPNPNPNLQLAGNWLSQGQASHGHNNSSIGQNLRPRPIKNSVYDPIYEQMGLPIDPHLRMFLASRESGNGDGF